MKTRTGTCYLFHFERPFGTEKQQARHYLGWTQNLIARVNAHKEGRGSRLLYHVRKAGIPFYLVRVWNNVPFTTEARIKNLGSLARVCPFCSPDKKWGQFK
jgi:hypothetical protein